MKGCCAHVGVCFSASFLFAAAADDQKDEHSHLLSDLIGPFPPPLHSLAFDALITHHNHHECASKCCLFPLALLLESSVPLIGQSPTHAHEHAHIPLSPPSSFFLHWCRLKAAAAQQSALLLPPIVKPPFMQYELGTCLSFSVIVLLRCMSVRVYCSANRLLVSHCQTGAHINGQRGEG